MYVNCHVKFGSSPSRVYAQIEANPHIIGERWCTALSRWASAWLTPRNTPLYHVCCLTEFGVLRRINYQTVLALLRRSA